MRKVNGGDSCQHQGYFYPEKNQTSVEDTELKCQEGKKLVKCANCGFWVTTDHAVEVDGTNQAAQGRTDRWVDLDCKRYPDIFRHSIQGGAHGQVRRRRLVDRRWCWWHHRLGPNDSFGDSKKHCKQAAREIQVAWKKTKALMAQGEDGSTGSSALGHSEPSSSAPGPAGTPSSSGGGDWSQQTVPQYQNRHNAPPPTGFEQYPISSPYTVSSSATGTGQNVIPGSSGQAEYSSYLNPSPSASSYGASGTSQNATTGAGEQEGERSRKFRNLLPNPSPNASSYDASGQAGYSSYLNPSPYTPGYDASGQSGYSSHPNPSPYALGSGAYSTVQDVMLDASGRVRYSSYYLNASPPASNYGAYGNTGQNVMTGAGEHDSYPTNEDYREGREDEPPQ